MEHLEQSDERVYTYCYILCTEEQRKSINLIEYKYKLQKLFKEFFDAKYVSSSIKKDRYILKLNESFKIGEKRQLGRLISETTDLNKHVYRFKYNNQRDRTGQLFRIQKGRVNETAH